MLGPKEVLGPKTNRAPKKLCPKFRENIISPNKCCVRKIKPCKKLGPKTLVKIGSVIADISLLWRNVTLKVKDCPRNLPLNFCQNQVSNIRAIAYMDKCNQDIVAWPNVTMTVGIC